MMAYLKNKKVLGVLIGTLLVIGLVGITPKILHSQNTEGGGNAPVTLLFWGYAFDLNGNRKPYGTPVYAIHATDPNIPPREGSVKNDNGYYEIYGHPGDIGEPFYLNYNPNATSGTGPVTAPAEVNIFPSQW